MSQLTKITNRSEKKKAILLSDLTLRQPASVVTLNS
jgi:hypothetical protein